LPESREKIKLKLIIETAIAFVLVVTLVFLLSFRLYRNVHDNTVYRVAETNQSMADLVSVKIDNSFEAIRANLILASTMRRSNTNEASIVKSLYEHLESKVIGISRMDSLGNIIATWPDTQVVGRNISNQTHVRETMRTHSSVISSPFETVQERVAIVIHEPVYLPDSVWNGSICALISLDYIREQMVDNLLSIGANAFLVDTTGQIVFHSDYPPGILLERIYVLESSTVLSELVGNLPKPYRGMGFFTDDSSKTYISAFSPVVVGPNIWTLGVYSNRNIVDSQLAGFGKELAFVLLALTVIIGIAFGGIVYFSLLKDKRSQDFSLREIEKVKEEMLNLAFDGFQMLIDYGNKNRGLQVVCDSMREAGDLKFCSICEFSADLLSINFPAVSYRDPGDRRSFFELVDTTPQRIKMQIDADSPEYRNLCNGHSLRLSKQNGISVFSGDMQNIVKKLLEIMNLEEIYLMPVFQNGQLCGLIEIIDEKPFEKILPFAENYREMAALMFRMSKTEIDMQKRNELFDGILQSMTSSIFIVDKNLNLIYFNKNFGREFDISEDKVGNPIHDIVPYIRKLGLEKTYREVLRTKRIVVSEEASYSSDTSKRFVRTTILPISSSKEGEMKILTVIEDITRQRELSEELKDTMRELKKQASTDGLTELYNYRYFSESLPKMIISAREAGANLCLVVLDLDNLKAYNDLGGHHYGDNLLRVVGHILTQHQSPGDIVARYGGDEFVMIMKNTELDVAKNRAELIRTSIVAYPFRDEEYLAGGNVTASFGVAALTEDLEDSDDLMRRADRALYRAKAEGKNRVRVWESST